MARERDGDSIGSKNTLMNNGGFSGEKRTETSNGDASSLGDAPTKPNGGDSASPVLARIDQYELVKKLGTGGFGSVYLARDTTSCTLVAVKGLPPDVRADADAVESVRDNFKLVAKLKHPNVAAALVLHKARQVAYFDADDEKRFNVHAGDVMLVMDYAPGVTLSQWRRQFPGRKVPFDKAVEVARQIAAALDFAHGRKIIHRDVKPANAMVETAADGSFAVRVLDFGLAAEVRSSVNRVSKEEVRDTSGTRQYMAPEQWEGKDQRAATDQYALAVLFHELVTGKIPFQSAFDCGDVMVMMTAVTQKAPDIPADLPRHVRKALERALAKDPKDRFPSCGDFVAALEGKGGGFFAGRVRAWTLAAGAALVLGVGAVGVVGIFGNGKRASSFVPAPSAPVATSAKADEAETVPPPVVERPKTEHQTGGLYMVVDLTDNTTSYLDAVPSGGWTDEYKTSKIVLRRIEPGSFMMGSPASEEGRLDREKQHEVTLTKPYYVGVFEVTQGQWERVMGNIPAYFKGPMRPVEWVSWTDADGFCGSLRRRVGKPGFCLPTEAQWEYACRAGTATAYFWGNALNGDKANCDGNYPCGTTAKGPYKRATCAVGSYAPNGWGLYDMHGNMWEWCADWYTPYDGGATDPKGPASGTYRVYRGGSWNDGAGYCRSAYRDYGSPGYASSRPGFRVALAPSSL